MQYSQKKFIALYGFLLFHFLVYCWMLFVISQEELICSSLFNFILCHDAISKAAISTSLWILSGNSEAYTNRIFHLEGPLLAQDAQHKRRLELHRHRSQPELWFPLGRCVLIPAHLFQCALSHLCLDSAFAEEGGTTPCSETWPNLAPFTEPETKAMSDFMIANTEITLYIAMHSYGEVSWSAALFSRNDIDLFYF